jgi:hypothetical protein
MLVSRSHLHGQKEEEGCQEGRQEEEGPRLSPPCLRELGHGCSCPWGFHSWGLGEPPRRNTSFAPPCRPTAFGPIRKQSGAFTLRRERPARALGRPGRPRLFERSAGHPWPRFACRPSGRTWRRIQRRSWLAFNPVRHAHPCPRRPLPASGRTWRRPHRSPWR